MRLALFDLDHTLLPLDSDHAWGQYTVRLGWRDPVAFAQANDLFYERYKAGTLDIAEYIRFATEALRERSADELATAHNGFMADVIRRPGPVGAPQGRWRRGGHCHGHQRFCDRPHRHRSGG
jgi:phosphoserine phosphatase